MRRVTIAISCTLFVACSPKDTAAPVASADNKPAAAGGQCIDEFVQVFEQTADAQAPASTENLCFDGADANGPPKFPGMSRKITLEYKQGDYLAVEESAHWTVGEFDAKRACTRAVLSRSKINALKRGEVKESTRLVDGKLSRSADTGDNYGSSIPLGAGPASAALLQAGIVPGASPQPSEESTPFGVACTRMGDAAGPGVSMCSVTQPRTCASARVMLPIEIRTPAATGGMQVGKTTALRVGAVVDSKQWVLP
jgi:hypothetical protein